MASRAIVEGLNPASAEKASSASTVVAPAPTLGTELSNEFSGLLQQQDQELKKAFALQDRNDVVRLENLLSRLEKYNATDLKRNIAAAIGAVRAGKSFDINVDAQAPDASREKEMRSYKMTSRGHASSGSASTGTAVKTTRLALPPGAMPQGLRAQFIKDFAEIKTRHEGALTDIERRLERTYLPRFNALGARAAQAGDAALVTRVKHAVDSSHFNFPQDILGKWHSGEYAMVIELRDGKTVATLTRDYPQESKRVERVFGQKRSFQIHSRDHATPATSFALSADGKTLQPLDPGRGVEWQRQ